MAKAASCLVGSINEHFLAFHSLRPSSKVGVTPLAILIFFTLKILPKNKKIGHITVQKHVNDVSNFFIDLFVGACIARPRTTDGRPYGNPKALINQELLACLFDSNCNRNSHTELPERLLYTIGVVTA